MKKVTVKSVKNSNVETIAAELAVVNNVETTVAESTPAESIKVETTTEVVDTFETAKNELLKELGFDKNTHMKSISKDVVMGFAKKDKVFFRVEKEKYQWTKGMILEGTIKSFFVDKGNIYVWVSVPQGENMRDEKFCKSIKEISKDAENMNFRQYKEEAKNLTPIEKLQKLLEKHPELKEFVNLPK